MSFINFSDRKISSTVGQQLPQFIQNDKKTFIQFLKSYYEFMEQKGGALDVAKQLQDYTDVTKTIDEYVDYFYDEIADSIPKNLIADKRKFALLVNRLYANKGTIESYKFLFRVLYNEDIDVYTPNNDMLIVSGSSWVKRNIIRIADDERMFSSLGLTLKGLSSEATGVVDFVQRETIGGVGVTTIFLSEVKGDFFADELFEIKINETTIRAKILPIIKDVTIVNSGSNYVEGDSIVISDTIGRGAIAKVASVDINTGGIKKISFDDFGVLYTNSTTASATSLSGSGAILEPVIGGLAISSGEYVTQSGHLSADKYIQDSRFYQKFSYVIRSGQSINFYRETLKKLLHPTGVALFGQLLINSLLDLGKNSEMGALVVRFFYTLASIPWDPTAFSQHWKKIILSSIKEQNFELDASTNLSSLLKLKIDGAVFNLLDFSLEPDDYQSSVVRYYGNVFGSFASFTEKTIGHFSDYLIGNFNSVGNLGVSGFYDGSDDFETVVSSDRPIFEPPGIGFYEIGRTFIVN